MNKIPVSPQLKSVVKFALLIMAIGSFSSFKKNDTVTGWIRINQLEYTPGGIKVAVSKDNVLPKDFQLVESGSSQVVFAATTGKPFGSYGPFTQSLRLNFSSYKNSGSYYLKCGQPFHLNLESFGHLKLLNPAMVYFLNNSTNFYYDFIRN
jgi:endoglucanase